jgi:hypothetical protein
LEVSFSWTSFGVPALAGFQQINVNFFDKQLYEAAEQKKIREIREIRGSFSSALHRRNT